MHTFKPRDKSDPSRKTKRACIVHLLAAAILLAATATAAGAAPQRGPKSLDPADHSFPTLGAPHARKVEVAWNRFYDHAGLGAILARLHEAFPNLTRLYSIGTSTEGRDLWCLEVTARNVGTPERKPGMYMHGNIHGNEVQCAETVAYTAWYLCHQYGRLEKVTSLLDERVFYLVPTINPDGRDQWFHDAEGISSRTGLEPRDDDRDGLVDEDNYDDLNGDGVITMMRIKDPYASRGGRHKPHPDYPNDVTVRTPPDELGEYCLLGYEGIDNDGDGRINEDGPGRYDLNRNWGYDWQPDYVQRGAHDYPFSQPETRAVAEFVLKHPNIAAAQTYHNAGGMILMSPGREGGAMHSRDEQVLRLMTERGEKILPFYRAMTVWKDLYTVWGSEHDWLYGGRGILTFTNELWTSRNLYKTGDRPSDEQEAEFIDHVLLGDGFVPWKEYDHPTYGTIEIGGRKKEWGRVPPSFLLEEELHRNMAFALYHAGMMPRLTIGDVQIEKLGAGLFKIWVAVRNSRIIPTRSAHDVANHINRPDVISLTGRDIKVLSGGYVADRFFQRVEAVERRPDRLRLDTIAGMDETRVQFVVSGRGAFTVTVDSPKGGLLREERTLP